MMNNSLKMKKHNYGSIVLTVVLVCFFVIIIFLSCLSFMAGTNANIIGRHRNKVVAIYASRAGLEKAIYEMDSDNGWVVGLNQETLSDSGSSYTVTFDSGQNIYPYSTNNLSGTSLVEGYGGRIVGPGAAYIISTGEFREEKVLNVAILRSSGSFGNSSASRNRINLKNKVIMDSYDSSLGSYEETKKDSDGHIRTNATQPGTVVLEGTVKVNGNITVGAGGSEDVVSGTGYTGRIIIPSSDHEFMPVEIPIGPNYGNITVNKNEIRVFNPGVYQRVDVNGGTLILKKGDYVFNEFVVKKRGEIKLQDINEPTQVYIKSTMNLNGSVKVNSKGKPSNLAIYGSNNLNRIDITKRVEAYICIYAPDSIININTGVDIYGALVGSQIDLTRNSNLHFDRSLRNFAGNASSGILMIKSRWQEYSAIK